MKWLCYGAGAVGTYIGGSLALAGEAVVFLDRPGALAELRRRGLRLDLSADRERRTHGPLSVAPDGFKTAGSIEEAVQDGPFDACIYALKSYDTAAAVQEMRPFVNQLPPVVCLSNGIDNEMELGRELRPGNVIAAAVTTAIGRRAPGDIILERLRGVGIASTHPLSERILQAARAARLNPRPYADPGALKWSKMLTNLIANPTSAILDMAASEVLKKPAIYVLEIRMLRECLAVMRAGNIPVVDLPRTPVRALAAAARLPAWLSQPFLAKAAGAGRGSKMPSFHIDLHAGRGRSEVEFLHGAVARVGRELGVATPVNAFLTATLMAMTRQEVPTHEYARQPEKLARAFASWERTH